MPTDQPTPAKWAMERARRIEWECEDDEGLEHFSLDTSNEEVQQAVARELEAVHREREAKNGENNRMLSAVRKDCTAACIERDRLRAENATLAANIELLDARIVQQQEDQRDSNDAIQRLRAENAELKESSEADRHNANVLAEGLQILTTKYVTLEEAYRNVLGDRDTVRADRAALVERIVGALEKRAGQFCERRHKSVIAQELRAIVAAAAKEPHE